MGLPDASADRAKGARQLPDLRHGSRADDAHGRRNRKSRIARHDAALLGRCRALAAVIAPRLLVWVQLILGTPAVLWCGWPFFERGWTSIVSRRLNMFTLIAL